MKRRIREAGNVKIVDVNGNEIMPQVQSQAQADAIADRATQRDNGTDDLYSQGFKQGSGAYRDRREDGSDFEALRQDPMATEDVLSAAFDDYLSTRYGNQYPVVAGAKKALFRIYSEIGSNPAENAFVTYLDRYVARNPSGRMTNDGIDGISNMYSTYVIDPEDLRGTTKDGRMSELFNDSIMDRNMTEVENIVKAYEWLGDKTNGSRVDFRSILNSQSVPSSFKKELNNLPEASKVLDSTNTTDEAIRTRRNLIIFEEGDPRKDIRDWNLIELLLKEGSRRYANGGSSAEYGQERLKNDFTARFNRLSDKEKLQTVLALWPDIADEVAILQSDGRIG